MLGKVLQLHRKAKSLTQRELAEALGYGSAQFVSDWEREYSRPPVPKIRRLSKLLAMPTDEILRWLIEDEKTLIESSIMARAKKAKLWA